MALLGRLEIVVKDPGTGLPVAGATVQVRKQGATVQGSTGPTTITVHAPGALAVGSTVVKDADDTVELAVSAVAAGSITVAGPGFTGLINDTTRISMKTAVPSVYNDVDGTEAISGATLQTDAYGMAFCYVAVGLYDLRINKDGVLTPTLLRDVPSVGGTLYLSTIFAGAGGTAYRLTTERTLTGTDLIFAIANGLTDKFSFRQDGRLTLGLDLVATGATLSGALVVSAGGLTITAGGLAINGGGLTMGVAGGNILVNQTTGTNEFKSNVKITNKDLQVRHIVNDQGTAMTTADIALGANWGAGAAITSVTNARNTAGRVRITSGAGPAGNADFTITWKDGGFSGTPHVIVQRAGGTLNVTSGMVGLIIPTTTNCAVTVAGNLNAATAYDYEWFVVSEG